MDIASAATASQEVGAGHEPGTSTLPLAMAGPGIVAFAIGWSGSETSIWLVGLLFAFGGSMFYISARKQAAIAWRFQQRVAYLTSTYGPDIAARILNGQLWQGANSQPVLEGRGARVMHAPVEPAMQARATAVRASSPTAWDFSRVGTWATLIV